MPDLNLSLRDYWAEFEPEPLTSIEAAVTWCREVERFCSRSLAGDQWRLVFRGQPNADYGLTSKLYRSIYGPCLNPRVQRVTDEMLLNREAATLHELRQWQLQLHGTGLLPALPLLATLQHLGGTTRLIDVTHSLLVAIWFAIEKEDDLDGRLFAMTYVDDISTSSPDLEARTDLFWHDPSWLWQAANIEQILVWTPPPVEKRMTRQQGAFVIGRAPLELHNLRALPTTGSRVSRLAWRCIMSINKRAFRLAGGSGRPPKTTEILLTAVIPCAHKRKIRTELERFFAMSERTMYPDLPGYVDWKAGRIGYQRL